MKSKTIKKAIREKIDGWLESIEDEAVRELASKNTIVTGGCIASMLLKEKVNDFDLYFRNVKTAEVLARYYIERFQIKKREGIMCSISVLVEPDKFWQPIPIGKGEEPNDDLFEDEPREKPQQQKQPMRIRIVVKSAGVASEGGTDKPYEYFESQAEDEAGRYVSDIIQDPGDVEETYQETEKAALKTDDEEGKPKHRPIFLSTNAITLSGKIQVILRFYGEPDDIHKNYDYQHCTNYWTSWNDELVLRKEALECLLARELIYVGSRYPVCSIFRLRKFLKRNFSVTAGQILKICMQISALDLTNIEVLQDQLTGVDCAYFIEVIGKLKEKDPTKVDTAYLIEIINRMF